MRKQPNAQQIAIIHDVLKSVRVDLKGQSIDFGMPDNKVAAFKACKDLTGYKPATACFSCYLKVLNLLRESVNLPPYDHGVATETADVRLSWCIECPAYHHTTRSCGRLGIDAISPKAVIVDGIEVNPCGCFLPLKVTMKSATCPAGKW